MQGKDVVANLQDCQNFCHSDLGAVAGAGGEISGDNLYREAALTKEAAFFPLLVLNFTMLL